MPASPGTMFAARFGLRAKAEFIIDVKVSSRISKVPLIVPFEAGLALHPLSMMHVAATETGVTPTACAFCDAASPQLRDIIVVIATLSAPSPEASTPVATPGVVGTSGTVETVPVGMVNGGRPTSSKVGMGKNGTPFIVSGTGSARTGLLAASCTTQTRAIGRRRESTDSTDDRAHAPGLP